MGLLEQEQALSAFQSTATMREMLPLVLQACLHFVHADCRNQISPRFEAVPGERCKSKLIDLALCGESSLILKTEARHTTKHEGLVSGTILSGSLKIRRHVTWMRDAKWTETRSRTRVVLCTPRVVVATITVMVFSAIPSGY